MFDLPTAKDLPYWKTGKSSPESWVHKACQEIKRAGGAIYFCLPSAMQGGRIAHVIGFSRDVTSLESTFAPGDDFKLVWPVLAHDPGDVVNATRQAATMLYHDVKSRCVAARVFGARWAFTAELVLPDGRTAGQLSAPEMVAMLPKVAMLTDDRSS